MKNIKKPVKRKSSSSVRRARRSKKATPAPGVFNRFMLSLSNRWTPRYTLISFIVIFVTLGSLWLVLSRASTTSDLATSAGLATAHLDPTGNTLPATNYAVPANATFMSTTGNDSNDGKSVDRPVKSINSAVAKTASGGTIVMRGGEYRDWHNNNNQSVKIVDKGLTIQAYPGESPWFNGSDIVNDGWTSDGSGHWVRTWETPSFCDGKYYSYSKPPYTPQGWNTGSRSIIDTSIKETACMYEDAANDPAYPMAGDPQQVFMNNDLLQEVDSKSKLKEGTFYYDWYARKMYVGTNPSDKTVEMSARPMAIVVAGAASDVHKILGIGFKKYATNGGEGALSTGAVYFTRKTILENSVFTQNATNAIAMSNPLPGTSIKHTVVARNGGSGMTANGASKTPGARNDILIEANIFSGNNVEQGGLYCNRACGPSNVKLAHMVGFTAKDNIFEKSSARAPGFWCDLDCSDAVIVNNIVRYNGGHGIYYEVSSRGIIASNILYDNYGSGIAVAASDTKIYNNTIVNKYVASGSRVQAIWIYDDVRQAPIGKTWPWHNPDHGPNTSNVQLANNVIAGPEGKEGPRLINALNGNDGQGGNTTADKYFSVFDYNAYYYAPKQALYGYISSDGLRSTGDMVRLSNGKFENNTIAELQNDNLFVNRSNNDYRLNESSTAHTNKGLGLPSDVAKALGLSMGARLPRGAIFPANTTAPTPPPAQDTKGPAIAITQPAPGATVSNTTSITATATDDSSIQKLELLVDGKVKSADTASPYAFSINTKDYANGNTVFLIRGYDIHGNVGEASITLQIHNVTPPSPTEPTPSQPPAADTQTPTTPSSLSRSLSADWGRFRYNLVLKWNASTDNTGVSYYTVTRNNSSLGTTTSQSFTDKTIAKDIDYTYGVTAHDKAGNVSSKATVHARASCFLVWCSL